MSNIFSRALDIFFPRKCILCNKIVDDKNPLCLCDKCEESVVMTYSTPDIPEERFFDGYAFSMPYYSYIKTAMLEYKFKNYKYLEGTFSHIACLKLKDEKMISDCHMVVCVPVSDLRLKERGYNQSEYIARSIAKEFGIGYGDGVLQKYKETPPVSHLNAAERKKAVKGVYRVNRDVSGKNILLIDDIYTTGSTVNECAGMLKKNGAARVDVFAVCLSCDEDTVAIYDNELRKQNGLKFKDCFF